MSTIHTFQDASREDYCSICLESLVKGNIQGHEVIIFQQALGPVQVRVTESVRHVFHSDCLASWLREQASCPLCKVTLYNPEEFNTDEKRGRAFLQALRNENRAHALRVLSFGQIDQRTLERVFPHLYEDVELISQLLSHPGLTTRIIEDAFANGFHNPDLVRLLIPRIESYNLISEVILQLCGRGLPQATEAIRSILSATNPALISADHLNLGILTIIGEGEGFRNNLRALIDLKALPPRAMVEHLIEIARRKHDFESASLLQSALDRAG